MPDAKSGAARMGYDSERGAFVGLPAVLGFDPALEGGNAGDFSLQFISPLRLRLSAASPSAIVGEPALHLEYLLAAIAVRISGLLHAWCDAPRGLDSRPVAAETAAAAAAAVAPGAHDASTPADAPI